MGRRNRNIYKTHPRYRLYGDPNRYSKGCCGCLTFGTVYMVAMCALGIGFFVKKRVAA